jgi:hypothetical protein
MKNLRLPGPTLCSQPRLQVQSQFKTLSEIKNDLLLLTGSGTWGCQQPW